MTATFDYRIQVNVVAGAALAGPRQFNRLLMLDPDASFGERVRWYSSIAAVDADANVSAAAKAFALVAFSQAQAARPLGIGKAARETAAYVDHNITGTAAGDWVVTLEGIDYTYTAAGGEGIADIAAGLRAALAAAAGYTIAAPVADIVRITRNEVGVDFVSVCTPAGAGTVDTIYIAATAIGAELADLRAEDNTFYGLVAPQHDLLEEKHHIAAWCAASAADNAPKLFVAGMPDIADAQAFAALGWTHAAQVHHTTDWAEFAVALASLKIAANPDITATVWDWARLAGVAADTMTAGEAAAFVTAYCNLYLPTDFGAATGEGRLASGLPIDQRVTLDWAAARIREAVAREIIGASTRNEKITYDNGGMIALASVGLGVLQRGERIGHFREESSEFDLLDIEDVDQADIDARLLRATYNTTLAGAITSVEFLVYAG